MAIKNTDLTINVRDLDASIAFYQSLGLSLAGRWGDHYAQLKAPGLSIGLHPSADAEHSRGSGNVSIGFTTDDFEGTHLLLQRLGIAVTERMEAGGRFLHFSDLDGTAIYFIEPKW